MTQDHTPRNDAPTFTQFPPLPLVSGDTFQDTEGNAHAVTSITVTITAEDGTTLDVPLEFRFGGWWAPQSGPR